MNAHTCALWLLLACPLSGCSVSHTTGVHDADWRLGRARRIAVLTPDTTFALKVFETEEYVQDPVRSHQARAIFLDAINHGLNQRGYRTVVIHDQPQRPGWKVLSELKRRLQTLSRGILEWDPDITRERLGQWPVPGSVGLPLEASLPPEARNCDLLIYLTGSVRMETPREAVNRWSRTLFLNLASVPFVVAGYFIPIALPLTVQISTSLYNPSPDVLSLRMLVVDLSERRAIWHHHYFRARVKLFDDLWTDAAEEFTDSFPDRVD